MASIITNQIIFFLPVWSNVFCAMVLWLFNKGEASQSSSQEQLSWINCGRFRMTATATTTALFGQDATHWVNTWLCFKNRCPTVKWYYHLQSPIRGAYQQCYCSYVTHMCIWLELKIFQGTCSSYPHRALVGFWIGSQISFLHRHIHTQTPELIQKNKMAWMHFELRLQVQRMLSSN